MTDLEARRRPQEGNHVRTIEQQTLDALLRVEELMSSILEGLRHFAKTLGKTEAPAEETEEKPVVTKGRRK